MKEGEPTTRKVRDGKRDGTPRLTISFSGELSHGKLKDMRMHEGMSVNFRVEDIGAKSRVGQKGYQSMATVNEAEREYVPPLLGDVVKTIKMNGFQSKRIVVMEKSF